MTAKERSDRYRVAHPDRIKAKAAREYRETMDIINAFKSVPCMDCGNTFPPECMDFDHRDSTTKVGTVSTFRRHSRATLMAEIDKCDVVCSNCHRIRTVARIVSARL